MTAGHFDIHRKFVRVMRSLPNGLIEFEFSIGDHDVTAELVMPRIAFEEFCTANRVEVLPSEKAAPPDAETLDVGLHCKQHPTNLQRLR